MALVAIPNIPPLVIPPATPASVQLVSTITGTGPWDWTGLNGDASGLVEYQIRIQAKRALLAGFSLGVRLNNDSGANYRQGGATPTSVGIATAGGAAINNLAEGVVFIPLPLSGSMRLIDGSGIMVTDDAPESVVGGGAGFWTSTAALTQITVVVTAGGVDSSSMSLYKVVSS